MLKEGKIIDVSFVYQMEKNKNVVFARNKLNVKNIEIKIFFVIESNLITFEIINGF